MTEEEIRKIVKEELEKMKVTFPDCPPVPVDWWKWPGTPVGPQQMKMPLCGCTIGDPCCNAACPYLPKVTS